MLCHLFIFLILVFKEACVAKCRYSIMSLVVTNSNGVTDILTGQCYFPDFDKCVEVM